VCGTNGKTYDNKWYGWIMMRASPLVVASPAQCGLLARRSLLESAACDDASIKLAKDGACAGGSIKGCPRPTNAVYWTGTPYSAPGGQTAVQVPMVLIIIASLEDTLRGKNKQRV
jgi:hypothetical protein